MRIKTLLGTTILASGLFFTQAVVPAMAAVGDPPIAFFQGNLKPGEVLEVLDGPNDFRIVNFRAQSNNSLISGPFESNEPNIAGSGGGVTGNNNTAQTYGDAAAFYTGPFQGSPGGTDVFSTINNIRGVVRPEVVIDEAALAAANEEKQARLYFLRLERRANELFIERKREREAELLKEFDELPIGRGDDGEVILTPQDRAISSQIAVIKQEIVNAKIVIDDANREIDSLEDGSQNDIDFPDSVFAPNEGSKDEEIKSYHLKKDEGFVTGAVIIPSADKISGKFHVARPQARMPWALSLNANYTGLDDDRNNANRDADIWSVTGTGAVQINRKTVLGASLTFKDGDVKSSNLNSTLDGTYYGFTLFASHQLTKVVNVTAFGGYTFGDNDINLNGATGSFNSNIFNGGLQIQGRYFFGDNMRFNPDVSVGLTNTKNDGFLASNGVDSDSTNITSFSASAGGTLSKTFVGEKGTFTPSLGLHAIYEDSSGGDLQLINGTTLANRLGFGATVSPAISFTMTNGATMGFNASYSQYDKDISSWTVGGSLKIPFN